MNLQNVLSTHEGILYSTYLFVDDVVLLREVAAITPRFERGERFLMEWKTRRAWQPSIVLGVVGSLHYITWSKRTGVLSWIRE